jgi:hypothetical protein
VPFSENPIVTLRSASAAKRARRAPGWLLAVALLAPACTSESPATIERETFVATYADLRVAALRTDSGWLSDAQRTDVLSRHGVTPEDLTTFADVHGPDLAFMRQLWNDVEVRMDSLRSPADDAEEAADPQPQRSGQPGP